MGLPQAIKDQEKKADQLVTQLAKGELVDVIVDDPSKAPVKETEEPEPEKREETPTVTTSKAEYDALNQRYQVLQGKYNHETAELRRSLDQANTTITRQNEMILDLHTSLNALEKGGGARGEGDLDRGHQPPAKGAVKGGAKKLDPVDFEGYGPEMKDLVEGFNVLLEENQQLKGTMAKSKETDADRTWTDFKSRMATLVPDWEVLNYDQGFLTWLEGTDSDLDPATRKQKLQYFVERMDANKCAKFFEVFKKAPGYTPSGAAGAVYSGPKKEDIVQPAASASGADSPIPGAGNKGEVTVEQYNQAVIDYTKKQISYEELEKISDAYQRGLAKKTGKK